MGTGLAAMPAAKRSAGVALEVDLGNVHYVRLHNVKKAAHSGFEIQRRRHQKSKTGVPVPPKKGHVNVSAKSFKKIYISDKTQ